MKKVLLFALAAALLFCGCGKKLGPADVLDNDTGKIYSLGDSKDLFDAAFGTATYSDITQEWDYLSEILRVRFDEENKATRIRVDSGTNRFSFYNFDFSKPMEDIKGRYSEHKMSEVAAYSLYFSPDGKAIELKEAAYLNNFIVHTLFVGIKDNELLNHKIGVYEYYYIELRDGLGLEKPG